MVEDITKLTSLEQQQLAANPDTSEDTLILLLKDCKASYTDIAQAILQNESTTKKVFQLMLGFSSSYIQWRTATEMINRYIKNRLQLTDNELIELAQTANAYKQMNNFYLISFVQDVNAEREKYIYCLEKEKS